MKKKKEEMMKLKSADMKDNLKMSKDEELKQFNNKLKQNNESNEEDQFPKPKTGLGALLERNQKKREDDIENKKKQSYLFSQIDEKIKKLKKRGN